MVISWFNKSYTRLALASIAFIIGLVFTLVIGNTHLQTILIITSLCLAALVGTAKLTSP